VDQKSIRWTGPMEESKKKIIFTVLERQKEDFKVRLQYDGLTQANFFRAVMAGYLEKDEDLMKYLNSFKAKNGIHNIPQRKKVMKGIEEAKKTKNLFALDDDEVENIFDILESEHPEL
jgi:hydroxylamine reductase (hybrid-cluster protein)